MSRLLGMCAATATVVAAGQAVMGDWSDAGAALLIALIFAFGALTVGASRDGNWDDSL